MTNEPRSSGPGGAPRSSDGFVKSLVADPRHGRLPILLLGLTIVTGLVDAVSILRLGRVFVANMTGNVVFLGFAAAGARGFSFAASLVALAGFLIGAGGGGRLIRRRRAGAPLLAAAAVIELVLVAGALGISTGVSFPAPLGAISSMAGLLALAMGLQNAVARNLAVPDLTTTVLTMALTGVAADPRGRSEHQRGRRLASVVAMFAGAIVGATLVIHGQVPAALGVAAVVLCVVGIAAIRSSVSPAGSVPG